MMIVLSKLLPVLVFPLGVAVELVLLALFLLWRRKTKPALLSLALSVLVLLFFSNEVVANAMARRIELRYLPVDVTAVKGDAIVVLGGPGRPKHYPRTHVEFSEGGERVFEGIRLYKAGAAPVVIPTGGGIDFILKGQKEGDDLKELMVEFGVPEKAVLPETEARNTYENAVYTKKLMEARGLGKRIILVTSAMHMVRSVPIFKKAGFEVIPAPCDYLAENQPVNWFNLLPMAHNLMLSTQAIREWIGIVAYKILGWL